MTTGIEIINNGASLKIVTDGEARLILKRYIRGIGIIRPSVIKLDLGAGPLNNVFINHTEVIEPKTATPDELRDAINEMMNDCCNKLNEIRGNVESINSKIFFEPLLVDEANPKAIYKGYAASGSKTADAVWAVQKISEDKSVMIYQWADGNKKFDKVWDNRKSLNYK
ncbi:MAG: hypothetical protein HYY40_13910 [Bacteroidetes bacterium]|nr:hypothetical protein [Bacteroidota bacterium]